MKKIIAFLIVCCLFGNSFCFAGSNSSEILMESESGTVLSSVNSNAALPMASLTKIMTAYVVIMHTDLSDTVTISSKSVGIEGSSMYLKTGEKYSVKELLYGLLLVSGNDAAHALALFTGKSIENFVNMMNDTAKELGLRNTSYKNPSGLYQKGHYTTARDLAVLTAAALENDVFSEIVATKKYTVHQQVLINHNRLLNEIDGCIGVKTGYTTACGRCLVSAVRRNGIMLICVTLNCSDDWDRHKKLYRDNFDRCECKEIIKEKSVYRALNVVGGHTVGYYIPKTNAVIIDGMENISYKLFAPPFIYCNKLCGDVIGKAEIYNNGNYLKSVPLICDRTTVPYRKRKTFFTKIKDFVLHIFSF